jgi:signal transduction histidine kinase
LDTGWGVMTISLRARLYLAVAVIIAVSVGVSAVLSRRATLVEVRQIGDQARDAVDISAAVANVQAAIASGGDTAAPEALAAFERETGRGFLVVDTRNRVFAASNRMLVGATVSTTNDGTVSLSLVRDALRVSLESVPMFHIQLAGEPMRLFALPSVALPTAAGEFASQLRFRPAVQPWLLSAAATGIVALALMYGLARRILRPIGALTDAARRMEGGDLAVRVGARGNDEIGELAHAFNAMAGRLAENERLRRQMVGDVAHELRTPVTNLRCILEGVQDGLEQTDRRTIDTLYDETMFLQRLIADLQDLTLAEAGTLPLQIGVVDVCEVIGRAVAAASSVPGGPAVIVEVPSGLDVQADRDRLEQVVRNLLTNARQHTPADGRINIRASRLEGHVKVEVADTGAGIAAEHLPHVFDRFYRADPSRSRRTGGAGLGLTIVSQLVVAQGGTVSGASDGPGRGATFRITLRAA